MAGAREALGGDFLSFYLNCPAWKFLLSPGVCGAQAAAGLTIPSVDKVGRYFNFTLATVLPTGVDGCAYALNNRQGFKALEQLALDILEQDLDKAELETRVREATQSFCMIPAARHHFEAQEDHIMVSQDHARPFADQSGALLSNLLSRDLQDFSIWWYGQEGQTRSQMVVCRGLPSASVYQRLLTLGDPPESDAGGVNIVDKIIAGEG
jgi:type VI secretion system protein ImpM